MLTRVYIDNFRGFVNFEYKPQAKQLLLGSNGSGKSSLLEAIRYVKDFVGGAENPFTQSTRTRWQDKPIQIVELEALLDGKNYEYRLETLSKSHSLKRESLRVDGRYVSEFSEGKLHFFRTENGSDTSLPFETGESTLRLLQLSNGDVSRFMAWMRDSVHVFDIDVYPEMMRDIADSEELHPDWELGNLAGWYRYLVGARPDENAVFVNSLRDTLAGIQSLRFSTEEEGVFKLRADFVVQLGKRTSYLLSELSDGQRKLLALHAILHFVISKGCTVFIDEPDNYIALREIQPWLIAAEQAVEDHKGQLILVSHHPEILNQWADEQGLLFYREDGGHVRTKRFESDGYLPASELVARGWESE